MDIIIGYLYYDVLNLYGETGNIKAIKRYLEALDIKVIIKFVSIGDDISLDEFDLIYMGSCTNNSLSLVLNDIMKYKEKFKEVIENNKMVIATGNSYELFGKTITHENTVYDALGVFNFDSFHEGDSIAAEVHGKSKLIDEDIIGFTNRDSYIVNKDENVFIELIKSDAPDETSKRIGFNKDDMFEGITYKNFLGTYTIGPLLIRNPKLCEYVVKRLLKEKSDKYDIKKVDNEFDIDAYNDFLNNL